MRNLNISSVYRYDLLKILHTFGLSGSTALSWSLKLLLIYKPANILIVFLLGSYLISIQQYSAVGLVLTAKSIARYNKISEDPSFAEYYLPGTLLSTFVAICISLLF